MQKAKETKQKVVPTWQFNKDLGPYFNKHSLRVRNIVLISREWTHNYVGPYILLHEMGPSQIIICILGQGKKSIRAYEVPQYMPGHAWAGAGIQAWDANSGFGFQPLFIACHKKGWQERVWRKGWTQTQRCAYWNLGLFSCGSYDVSITSQDVIINELANCLFIDCLIYYSFI